MQNCSHYGIEIVSIQSELSKLGLEAMIGLSSSTETGKDLLLQGYDRKWETFLNMEELNEVCDGDKITVTPKPAASLQIQVCLLTCTLQHSQSSLFLY